MYYLFPIFLELKEWTLIDYWHKIFEDCALGKFPDGITIQNDIIKIERTGEEINLKETIKKNPENYSFVLYLKIMDIFKELNLSKDKPANIECVKNWSTIKQKYTKNNLILEYVIKCKEIHNLDDDQVEHLFSNIQLGLMFKVLSPEDIIFENGKIIEIKKILIKDKKINFDLYTIDRKVSSKPVIDKKNQFIEKFIKEHKNNILQYNDDF